MATTSPFNIPLIGPDSIVNPIETPLNAMANAVNEALVGMGYPASYTGTNAERLALAAPYLRDGITFQTTDTRLNWRRDNGSWKLTGGRPIVCQLTSSVAQGWATSLTTFKWGGTPAVPIIDTDSFWNPAQNSRMTIPHTGYYKIEYSLSSTGIIAATTDVYKNGGTTQSITKGSSVGVSGAATAPRGSGILPLNAGDYLEVKHQSPSTGSGSWAPALCSFSAEYLGQL